MPVRGSWESSLNDAVKTDGKTGGRQLKKSVLGLLTTDPFEASLEQLLQMPLKRVISPILGFLCADDEMVRWRAVTAAGAVVARLASEDREAAREIVRRLMWTLNEESGGIGWGAPEAMAEIIARDAGLAREYAGMLVSYLNPRGNFLEHELLQRGVLWGVVRLARVAPNHVEAAAPYLRDFLSSRDAGVRGLAAAAAGALCVCDLGDALASLLDDEARFREYDGTRVVSRTVKEAAEEALHQCSRKEYAGAL